MAQIEGLDIEEDLDDFLDAMERMSIINVDDKPSPEDLVDILTRMHSAMIEGQDAPEVMRQAEDAIRAYGQPAAC